MRKKILIFIIFGFSLNSFAAGQVGRLGVGLSGQLENGMKALSIKLQKNRSTGLGAHVGLDSSSEGVFYAIGAKGYKYIYEEPLLNFYSALSFTLFSYKDQSDNAQNGYQLDAVCGAEFSLQGVESVGFSFEFGVGLSRYQDETHLKTIGHHVLASAVHFYL